MNQLSRTDVASRIAALDRIGIEPAAGSRASAAVAIIIADSDAGQGIWLTERASTMRKHAGQFALPGGRLDEGEGEVAAAVRETQEEIGLRLDVDDCLGLLDDYETRSGFVISPVVFWAGEVRDELVLNPAEVARAHFVTFEELSVAPRFVEIPESDRSVIQMPIVGDLIHAPTGALLYQFAELVIRGRVTRVADFEQPLFAWK